MFRRQPEIWLLCAAAALSVPAWGQVQTLRGREAYVPGEILLRLKPGASLESRAKALASAGTPQALGLSDLFKVRLKKGMEVPAAVAQMQGDPAVQYAQPNYRYYALGVTCTLPTDTEGNYTTAQSWPFLKIQMDKAVTLFNGWTSCPPGSNATNPVTVAVLDSGVSRLHPDLKAVPLIGYNAIAAIGEQDPSCTSCTTFSNPACNACGYGSPYRDSPSASCTFSMDDFGHGTYVAGILAADWGGNNQELSCGGAFTTGSAGMAPGITLLAIKVLDCTGSGTTDSLVAGTNFAVNHGARVLNFSLGSSGNGGLDPAEQEALDNALAHNCVIVASAGNESYGGQLAPVDYPAAYAPVIAVGATDLNDNVSFYSNGGPGLDLVAPGGAGTGQYRPDSDVFSTFLCPLSSAAVSEGGFSPVTGVGADSNFGTAAGTSAAAPFVSAAAALLFSVEPSLTNTKVAQAIINNADSLNGGAGWDPKTGYGRLNVYQALLNAGTGGRQVTPYLKTFNSPNPFYPDVTGTTNITLAVTQAQPVELFIYDSAGETLLHKLYAAADLNQNPSNPQFKSFYVPWDGRNGAGQKVKTGIYFYAVKSGGQTGRNKIALIQGGK